MCPQNMGKTKLKQRSSEGNRFRNLRASSRAPAPDTGATRTSNAALAPSGLQWVRRPSRTSSWFLGAGRGDARSPSASLRRSATFGTRERAGKSRDRIREIWNSAPATESRKQAKFPPRRAPPPAPPSRESSMKSLVLPELSRELVGLDRYRHSTSTFCVPLRICEVRPPY